jgi:hypothetical protein
MPRWLKTVPLRSASRTCSTRRHPHYDDSPLWEVDDLTTKKVRFQPTARCAIHAARGKWGDAALSCISMIPVIGDAIGKGGKVLKAAFRYGDEVVGAIKQGVKHGDEFAAGANKACKSICPNGGGTCFTAGHQVLVVVGEVDEADMTESNATAAAFGRSNSIESVSPTNELDADRWESLTVYVGVFIVAAGVVGWGLIPRWLRRRSLRTQAIDEVLADDDTLALRHPWLADDIDQTEWHGHLELQSVGRPRRT